MARHHRRWVDSPAPAATGVAARRHRSGRTDHENGDRERNNRGRHHGVVDPAAGLRPRQARRSRSRRWRQRPWSQGQRQCRPDRCRSGARPADRRTRTVRDRHAPRLLPT